MARTGSLRTQSARHRVDHGTICGRTCANSGHYKPLCACVDRTFVNPNSSRRRPGRARIFLLGMPPESHLRRPAMGCQRSKRKSLVNEPPRSGPLTRRPVLEDCVAKLFCLSQCVRLIQDQTSMRNVDSRIHSPRFDCCVFLFYSFSAMTFATQSEDSGHRPMTVTACLWRNDPKRSSRRLSICTPNPLRRNAQGCERNNNTRSLASGSKPRSHGSPMARPVYLQ